MSRQDREDESEGDGENSGEGYYPPLENFELNFQLLSTAKQLIEACDELDAQASRYATAHRDFKREWAKAYLASIRKTVDDRKADADIAADDYRFQNYLHEGLMKSALERVRSLRGILSSFQTIGNRQTEEMKFSRTGPQYDK
jgi:hypothetical protein